MIQTKRGLCKYLIYINLRSYYLSDLYQLLKKCQLPSSHYIYFNAKCSILLGANHLMSRHQLNHFFFFFLIIHTHISLDLQSNCTVWTSCKCSIMRHRCIALPLRKCNFIYIVQYSTFYTLSTHKQCIYNKETAAKLQASAILFKWNHSSPNTPKHTKGALSCLGIPKKQITALSSQNRLSSALKRTQLQDQKVGTFFLLKLIGSSSDMLHRHAL